MSVTVLLNDIEQNDFLNDNQFGEDDQIVECMYEDDSMDEGSCKIEEYDEQSDHDICGDMPQVRSSVASAAYKASVIWQAAQDKGALAAPLEVLTPPRAWQDMVRGGTVGRSSDVVDLCPQMDDAEQVETAGPDHGAEDFFSASSSDFDFKMDAPTEEDKAMGEIARKRLNEEDDEDEEVYDQEEQDDDICYEEEQEDSCGEQDEEELEDCHANSTRDDM